MTGGGAFRIAHEGGADDWRALLESCLVSLGDTTAGTLGFVYATDVFAESFAEIVATLKLRTGVTDWVGTLGVGIVAGAREYFDEPAIAVMIADLPRERFRLLPAGAGAAAARSFAEWARNHGPSVAVVHGDGRAPALGEELVTLADEAETFAIGGLGSTRVALAQAAGAVARGALSGVAFAHDVIVATGLTQGCTPIGPTRRVTAAQDNIVRGLDDLTALEALERDIAALPERERDDALRRLHVALPVVGSDRADYLVRNLVGADRERGWLAVGDIVEPGRQLIFVRRDADAASRDLTRMAKDAARRAGGATRAAVYFSCLARGPNLFGPGSRELAQLRRELGDVPLIGMFCDGEICNARLYGYTGVLGLFA